MRFCPTNHKISWNIPFLENSSKSLRKGVRLIKIRKIYKFAKFWMFLHQFIERYIGKKNYPLNDFSTRRGSIQKYYHTLSFHLCFQIRYHMSFWNCFYEGLPSVVARAGQGRLSLISLSSSSQVQNTKPAFFLFCL